MTVPQVHKYMDETLEVVKVTSSLIKRSVQVVERKEMNLKLRFAQKPFTQIYLDLDLTPLGRNINKYKERQQH